MLQSKNGPTSPVKTLNKTNRRGHFLIAGEIHYARVIEGEWERLLDASREAGLTAITTRAFWSLHEPRPGLFDFSGRADVGRFLQLCKARGLDVILRLGPYADSSWSYGGLPFWLRDGAKSAPACFAEYYLGRLEMYLGMLLSQIADELTPGGSVLFLEINRLAGGLLPGEDRNQSQYQTRILQRLEALGLKVPIVLEDAPAVRRTKPPPATVSPRTISRPWIDLSASKSESAGEETPAQSAWELGYEFLRLIANRGTAVNYRLWQSATNAGRSAAYLQSSSPDLDAPLNALGERTGKFEALSSLHLALHRCEALFAGVEPVVKNAVTEGGGICATWGTGKNACAISINSHSEPRTLSVAGRETLHPPRSACLWKLRPENAQPLWKTWTEPPHSVVETPACWEPFAADAPWLFFPEPAPSLRRENVSAPQPLEQLTLTRDATDYCWYVSDFASTTARRAKLRIARGGDFFYVFINGRLADRTRGSLVHHRGPTIRLKEKGASRPSIENRGRDSGYEQTFSIPLNHGHNRIDILACSLGLVGGEGEIGMPLQYERKGIWGSVDVDGHRLEGWRHYPGLIGEKLQADAELARDFSPMISDPAKPMPPLTWYLKEFELPPRFQDSGCVWAFDASGVEKGTLWLNGHALARVVRGVSTASGIPPQRYYFIPASWLGPRNRLVVFSESGFRPGPEALVYRPRRASTARPSMALRAKPVSGE